MATLTITMDFSSDNGDAENFTSFSETDYLNGVYDSGVGNPAGSCRIDSAKVTTAFGRKFNFQSFEAWGVPAGATIDSITNWTIDGAYFETGASNGTNTIGGGLAAVSSLSSIRYNYTDPPASGDWSWQTIPLVDTWDGDFPYASTDTLYIYLDADMNLGAGGAGSCHYDNISFDINYTTGADSIGTGAIQAQVAKVSGSGDALMVAYATGAIQAQDASVSGYSQSLPSVIELVKVNTADSFILYADGVSVPLIQFTVRRNTATETAAITAPVDFEDIIAAATVISIDMVSTDVYGTETTTELFTGALADYSTSRSGIISNCTGAASWPANAVRDFGNVSYITDDANYNAYRLSIDPRFYPGDVGMYGLRRININRVTFSVNQNQAFMELSSVGQV